MTVRDCGKMSYQVCIESGHDPKVYADSLAGLNGLGKVAELATRDFISKNAPGELPFFKQSKIAVLKGFREAAREAGDKETSAYVANLIKSLNPE